MLPSAVVSGDLKPEVEEKTAHNQVAKAVVSFMNGAKLDQELHDSTATFYKPLLAGMELEGSYEMKDPCYDQTLVNQNSPKCLHGSKWSPIAQSIMGGKLPGSNEKIVTDDNFHQVYTVTPVHLPQFNNSCTMDDADCTLESITVTENYYNRLSPFDTGLQEIGAVEMKAKLMSRQSTQVAGGDKNSDFHKDDEVGNRCGDINQKALQWAMDNASPKALEKYNKLGKKLVIGDDLGPYNAGPLWIWTYLSYKDNADKTETVLQAPMMRTPTDYSIAAAAGFHYCKLLSPFRTIEWIYID